MHFATHRAIKIGDKEVEYNQKFRLILHTKLANPVCLEFNMATRLLMCIYVFLFLALSTRNASAKYAHQLYCH